MTTLHEGKGKKGDKGEGKGKSKGKDKDRVMKPFEKPDYPFDFEIEEVTDWPKVIASLKARWEPQATRIRIK